MGASLGSGGSSSGRGNRRRRRGGFSDINVTPMVDVMLVLLIIFMVAAPMLTSGVQVDLPKIQASPLQGQDEPLTVSVQADDKIFLNKSLLSLDELEAKLRAVAAEKPETRIFVRGDKNVDYGRIMHVVGAITGAGLTKVALITDSSEGNATRKGK